MITWIKIAVRNILKNGRRSFYTILAIALAFSVVNLFKGFTSYIFLNLKYSFIYSQAGGHLTIFKRDFLEKGQFEPGKYLITEGELQTIRQVCSKDPNVLVVTPKLQITGMVSNGKVSTIFFANGEVPSDVYTIHGKALGMVAGLRLFNGKPLDDAVPYGVGFSSGLSKKLNMPLGSTGTIISMTVDGMVNALDVEVFQTFESPMEVINDKVMNIPLGLAQSLWDTTSVDRVAVLLREMDEIDPVLESLDKAFRENGLDVELKSWQDLSPFYRKVKRMFQVIFTFISTMVFIVAVMSVVNTIGMSVMERIREIGTLRALGLERKGVVRLFAIESAVLGFLGCVLGSALTLLGWFIVRAMKFTWVPPHITKRVPLEVYLVPDYMILSMVFLIILAVGSAMLPAGKASRQSIVDALGHV